MAKGPKPEEAPKGSPMWMTTYSDLVSLLMCFFIMLFAMSSVDVARFEAFAAGMARTESIIDFGGESIMELMGAGIVSLPIVETASGEDSDGPGTDKTGTGEISIASPEYAEMQERFEAMADQLQTYFDESDIAGEINLEVAEQAITIRFGEGVLFDSGQAALKPASHAALAKAVELFGEFPESGIRIEGYTDNVPINTVPFPTNYHLSYGRAYAVLQFFETQGLDVNRMHPIGYGENHPVDTNETAEGRANNRRVEIIIMSQYYTTGQSFE